MACHLVHLGYLPPIERQSSLLRRRRQQNAAEIIAINRNLFVRAEILIGCTQILGLLIFMLCALVHLIAGCVAGSCSHLSR